MFFRFFNKNKNVQIEQDSPFDLTIIRLNESAYCKVNEEEFYFIKLLYNRF